MKILEVLTPSQKSRKMVVSFSNRKTSYIAMNPDEKLLHIYENLDKNSCFHNLKCVDHAIYTDEDILYLIELKGTDLKHGYEQVVETHKHIKGSKDIQIGATMGRIVCNNIRYPELQDNHLKSLKRECKARNIQVTYKSRSLKEKI